MPVPRQASSLPASRDWSGEERRSDAQRRKAKPLFGTPGSDGFLDPHFNLKVFKLLPGDFFVTRRHEIFTTVLGSCISACIRDPVAGVGGMNHFMLPTGGISNEGVRLGRISAANCYGTYAMESLINALLKFGGEKRRFEVKIFGGAAVIPGMSDVGARNIAFAREFLQTEGLPIVAENVGGTFPRRINYLPRTGEVLMKRLRSIVDDAVVQRERDYASQITQAPAAGEIELFD